MIRLSRILQHFEDGVSAAAYQLLSRMIRQHGTQASIPLSLQGNDGDHKRLADALKGLESGKIKPTY